MSVFFINPFLGAVGGNYESIATVTVSSGFPTLLEFTGIPSTYQHLQLRWFARLEDSGGPYDLNLRFNADTWTNYAWHRAMGVGSSVGATSGLNATAMNTAAVSAFSFPPLVYTAGVIDILDYGSTSKSKVVRGFSGFDTNNNTTLLGRLYLGTGLWNSVSPITSIQLSGGSFRASTTAALYGIKAP